MSDWQSKSDFEINKAVAETQQFTYVIGDGLYPSQSDEAVHVERKYFKYGNIEQCGVDYCNNPSDAWPIIVKNKISIHHDIARYSASSLVYDKCFENGFKVFNYNGEIGDISSRAALRAAMIVYLEMNGVKP